MSTKQKACRWLAVAMVVSGLTAPTASAIPMEEFFGPTPPASQGQEVRDPLPVSDTDLASRGEGQSSQAEAGQGFDWGDAGIGAAAMFALTGIAAGAALVLGHSRRPVA